MFFMIAFLIVEKLGKLLMVGYDFEFDGVLLFPYPFKF